MPDNPDAATDIEKADTPSFVCPECGEERPNALTLGLHRRNAHGVVGRDKRRRKDPGIQRPAAVSVVKEMANDAGAGKRTGTPGADELTKAFGRAAHTVSQAVSIYAVETDPRLTTDELRETTVDYLALSRQASNDVMEPLARAFHRTPLNKRMGRAVVDNVDVVGSLAELSIMFLHWRRYFGERRAYEQAMRDGGTTAMQRQPTAPPPPAGGAATQPPPATFSDGHVWTKEEVDQMRRARG